MSDAGVQHFPPSLSEAFVQINVPLFKKKKKKRKGTKRTVAMAAKTRCF